MSTTRKAAVEAAKKRYLNECKKIADEAKAAGRNLTPEEKRFTEAKLSTVEELNKELRSIEDVEAKGRRIDELMGVGSGSDGSGLLAEFRSAGWEPGKRASVSWDRFKAVTFTGGVANLGVLRREGEALGYDRRFAFPAFEQVPVSESATSVQVMRQNSRTLATPASMVRAIDATSSKPETDSGRELVTVNLSQVASKESGIPNIYMAQDGFASLVQEDLGLAFAGALDKLVLDAIATAGFQSPGTDPLLISIRKAMTTIRAAGYEPDTLILTPAADETLDTLRTDGTEKHYVFGPGNFATEIFGLNRRISKTIPAPAVVDASAFGKLYVSPVSLQSFEENDGATNTQLVRIEANGAFGTERAAAAVRIAAA